jgi:hypothetical protein
MHDPADALDIHANEDVQHGFLSGRPFHSHTDTNRRGNCNRVSRGPTAPQSNWSC